MVANASGRDHTDAMETFIARKLDELRALDLAGFVLKSRSPSCGMEGVEVRSAGGEVRRGAGLFAEALLRGMPQLPVEEEVALRDPARRRRFLERMHARRPRV